MKTIIFSTIAFILIMQSANAITYEQLTMERYKQAQITCAERKTDAQRIACLEDMVRYMQAKIDWKCNNF